MSDNLDEAKVFYLDVENKPSIRMEIAFGDFHNHNVAYHCGSAITVSGTGVNEGGQIVIKKIKELRSVHGKLPGSAPG